MIRRLHVTGSADPEVDLGLLSDVRTIIADVVEGWVEHGGTLVGGLGGEPLTVTQPELPIIFDWTVAEATLKALEAGNGFAGTGVDVLLWRVSAEPRPLRTNADPALALAIKRQPVG